MKALDWLKKSNEFLSKVPDGLDAYFNGFVKSAGTLTQEEIDVACERASWYVNITVERWRQKILKTLHEQYEDYLDQIGPVSAVVKMLSDPLGALGEIANVVKKILKLLIGPYQALIEFSVELVKEVAKLAENLTKIASYKPKVSMPNANLNKFKLKVSIVSFGDVVQGPDGLPAPEVLYPEPPALFSKDSFQNSFDEARNKMKESTKKYNLN